jgi:GMP synthase-like glutamine amidotransferase
MHFHEPLPRAEEVDSLLICGGGMNTDQANIHPWLNEERKLIEQVLKRGGRVIGLCLGAQLTAEVLGAKVSHYKDWEIGWHDIHMKVVPGLAGFEVPQTMKFFQWHCDVFELPSGAKRIAWNDWWQNQAYLWNDQALCFQFHPETNQRRVQAYADDKELPITGNVQTAVQITAGGAIYQPRMQRWFERTLEGFLLAKQTICKF